MPSPLQQNIKITGPSIITANRTWDGAVIYRTGTKSWSDELTDAAIVRTADEARALLSEAVADDLNAIGPYIAPVEVATDGAVKPGNTREHIRLTGTTIALPAQA